MELRVLRYFLAVAREESISGAAEFLHVTQPTLSRQLMDLETELGTKLFLRGNRKITLTDEGMLLRKRAEEIVDLVQKAEAELTASDEMVGGDIYIGGGETHVMSLIAGVVKDLQHDYPDIRVHLYSGNADDVTERLDKGLLDFGILIDPANLSKYESLRLPLVDTWGVLMRRDSPLSAREVIEAHDLWDKPLITSRQAHVSDTMAEWFGREHGELKIVATYNLIFNASILVREGLGYALTLDKLVNTTGESDLCFRPLKPGMASKLNMVWKKYQVFSRASELFLKRMETRFG